MSPALSVRTMRHCARQRLRDTEHAPCNPHVGTRAYRTRLADYSKDIYTRPSSAFRRSRCVRTPVCTARVWSRAVEGYWLPYLPPAPAMKVANRDVPAETDRRVPWRSGFNRFETLCTVDLAVFGVAAMLGAWLAHLYSRFHLLTLLQFGQTVWARNLCRVRYLLHCHADLSAYRLQHAVSVKRIVRHVFSIQLSKIQLTSLYHMFELPYKNILRQMISNSTSLIWIIRRQKSQVLFFASV
jgi:hypothetical protein